LSNSSGLDNGIGVPGELGQHLEHFEDSKLIGEEQFEGRESDVNQRKRDFVLDGVVGLFGVVKSELFRFEELSVVVCTFWR
jgi:hypothetical protein